MHPQPAMLLKQARTRYTQRELANHIGKDIRTLRRWETGQTPCPDMLGPALQLLLFPSGTTKQPESNRFRFIDLFAGIGGIRKGFETHGGQCVFTSEWNDFSKKAYLENFGDTHPFAGDITRLHADEIPDHVYC